MPLPKLQHPTFDVTIPSTKKVYSFRPYTVREQKILLMMKESGTTEEIIKNVKGLILSTCQEDLSKIIDTFTFFDIEYIFLQIRINSVGETSKLSYRCNNVLEDSERCNHINVLEIDLREAQVDFSQTPSSQITIPGGYWLSLKYPAINTAESISEYHNTQDLDVLIKLIWNCIESIGSESGIIEDYNLEEFSEFIKSLEVDSFEKILAFLISQPILRITANYSCEKCGYSEELILEGISDFFE